MTAPAETGPPQRLSQRLLGYLQHDPNNLTLIGDAASAAFKDGDSVQAAELLDRHEALAPLTPPLLNLRGLVALSGRDFAASASVFEALVEQGVNDPAIRFNLAWSKAMVEDYEAALGLLDDGVLAASPEAPRLKVQLLQHLGRVEDAVACGEALVERFPDDQSLIGALSVACLDASDFAKARDFAERSPTSPDGLSTLGMIILEDGRAPEARALFDQALELRPDDARALLGQGLEMLVQGNAPAAVQSIGRGAEIFGTHVGSWIALGWANFVAGNLKQSRESFERALALDDRFAETQGALAVLDIVEGRLEEGKRRAEVARRLDRNCLSAVLAQTMILTAGGKPDSAERLRELAFNRPLDASGRTLAKSMIAFGLKVPSGTLLN